MADGSIITHTLGVFTLFFGLCFISLLPVVTHHSVILHNAQQKTRFYLEHGGQGPLHNCEGMKLSERKNKKCKIHFEEFILTSALQNESFSKLMIHQATLTRSSNSHISSLTYGKKREVHSSCLMTK